MKHYLLSLLLFSLLCTGVRAQVISTANADSGSGYPALMASGFELEDPDCVHTGFGPHITQAFDAELDRNVFVFHSHIAEDNDRCLVFDRVRMEIKGSANTIPELRHSLGDTTYYRWKFRLDENFVGTSSFSHLFQNKAVGGSDSSFPILTITARANRVEVKHDGGDTGDALGSVAEADITNFRGQWVEGYIRQVHKEDGELDVTITDMATGRTILEYSNDNIDLWRAGAQLNRPKWGVYRSKNDALRDEDVRFANFCVSEEAEALCPAEAVLQPDTEAPTLPTDLAVTATTFTTVSLEWAASADVYGVTAYVIYNNGDSIAATTETEAIIARLMTATEYIFTVSARDAAGNDSGQSEAVTATTDDANALPNIVTSPTPADAAMDVNPQSGLSWTEGSNTETFEVFFGTTTEPASVRTQTINNYQPAMVENTTYYWRIDATNQNGTTAGPLWSFTTGNTNPDAPWYTYRGNARPEIETGFFELNTAPGEPTLDVLLTDPEDDTNSIFGYRSNTDENFRWRFALDERDSTITIVTRVRGIDDDASGIMHLDIRAFGWRQKVRLNSRTIKFERSSPTVEENLPFDWNDGYHIVRLVVTGKTATVYLDESSTPFMSGESNDPRDQSYFEWGKSGGDDYGAFVDYMALNTTEASAPGEGSPLPGDLFPGSVATFEPLLQAALRVYPNPASDIVTVELPAGSNYTGQLFSIDGRAATGTFTLGQGYNINVSTLRKGLYVLMVRSQAGEMARAKLLID
jgi:chitodextrinase